MTANLDVIDLQKGGRQAGQAEPTGDGRAAAATLHLT
jgi:hypothetical protein